MPHDHHDPRISNSIFPGLNDTGGIMLCGYELGFNASDQKAAAQGKEPRINWTAEATFCFKKPRYEDMNRLGPFDQTIIKWFKLWGHDLDTNGLGSDFDKRILQANWCDSQAARVEDGYMRKLLAPHNREHFLDLIKSYRPALLMLMGSRLIDGLNHADVLPGFSQLVGQPSARARSEQKSGPGRRFRVHFQTFERCEVVCLPHPSGSRGLSDEYMAQFKSEIGELLARHR